MNEAIFETDRLLGEPQPAKPIMGDSPGDQPVMPPAAVPEQGGFERAVSEYKGCLDFPDYDQSSERVFFLRLLLKDLTAAHNRDMSESRKRIAELETELKRSNSRAAKHYRAFCDEQERRSKDEAAFQEYRGRLEAENKSLMKRIAALEAENAQLRAERHGFRRTEAISIASAIAHRACCGTEHDPANGKIHGYCVVCGVPWPCDTAKSFMPPESISGDKEDA